LVDWRDEEIHELGERGFLLKEDFAPARLVDAVHNAAERTWRLGGFQAAGIRRGGERALDQRVRSDQTLWVHGASMGCLAELYGWFAQLGESLSRAAYLGLRGHEVQLARYEAGGSYARHRDAFPGDDNRRLTATLYLNRGWSQADGGALRLHLPEGALDITPRAGTLVAFLSERLEHEVLPATAVRYAATAWFDGRAP
jgi:SM-20-related protein